MKNIVALTKGAVNLASHFEKHSEYYNIYKISKHAKKAKNSFILKGYDHPEEYDKSVLNLKTFFKNLKGDILFFVCGASLEAAATLRVLEHLKKHNICIVYIIPEKKYLNEIEKLNERSVFHILQEYTRSGVFDKMFIVDNRDIEGFLKEELTIEDYYHRINELICNTLHMVNVFDNTPALFQNVSPLSKISRIATFGIGGFCQEEKKFFSLDKVEEKSYYFAMSKTRIQEQGLLEKVKEHMEKNSDTTKINYQIYSTDYAEDYVYSVSHTSKIQNIA